MVSELPSAVLKVVCSAIRPTTSKTAATSFSNILLWLLAQCSIPRPRTTDKRIKESSVSELKIRMAEKVNDKIRLDMFGFLYEIHVALIAFAKEIIGIWMF